MKSQTKFMLLVAVFFVLQSFQIAFSQSSLITVTKVEPRDIAPIQGESSKILFSLSKDAKVTVKIFDLDNKLVALLMDEKECSYGLNSVTWDGRDANGEIVADSAYYFTISGVDQAGAVEFYNPIATTGGLIVPVSKLDSEQGIAYSLPEDAKVRVRIGIHNGPLLKTLVDWVPRRAGDHQEVWDGYDESRVIKVDAKEYTVDIQAYSLPENSIVTHGSGMGPAEAIMSRSVTSPPGTPAVEMNLKQRKRLLSKQRVARDQVQNRVHSHYNMPAAMDRAPRFSIKVDSGSVDAPMPAASMDSTVQETATPDMDSAMVSTDNTVVSGTVTLEINLEELSGIILSNTRYEVITYIDDEFYMEDEQGYHPYTFQLDTTELSDGVHTVVFNIATLTDQVGSGSISIMVNNN